VPWLNAGAACARAGRAALPCSSQMVTAPNPTKIRLAERMKNGIALSLGLSLGPLLAAPPAAAQALPVPTMVIPEASSKPGFDLGFSTGFDYVTGAKCSLKSKAVACSSTGTTAFAVPATVMAQLNRVRLQVTVPFVDIEGPGNISGVLGVPEVVADSATDGRRRSGLGDVSVGSALILIREGRVMPRIEIAGIVKLPTGRNGLGTGKTDYGTQLTFYRPLWTGITTFGSVGYQWVGDVNTTRLHDGARATAGLDFDYGVLGAGALLDYRQSLWQGAPNSFTLDPYVTLRMFGRVGVSVYTTLGLTRESPGRSIGFRLVL